MKNVSTCSLLKINNCWFEQAFKMNRLLKEGFGSEVNEFDWKIVNSLVPKVICQLIMKQEEKGITHRGARGHNWVTLFFNRLTITLQLQMTSEIRLWHQLSLFYRLKDKELCWERRHTESSGTMAHVPLSHCIRLLAGQMHLLCFYHHST